MNDNRQEIQIKKEIIERLVRAFDTENFKESTRLIPYDMRPSGAEVPYRCCIHKERAIIKDRIIASLGFRIEEDDDRKNLYSYAKDALEREKPDARSLTMLKDACKGCVPNQIYVTDLCQGCVSRACERSCKFGAINVSDGRSKIDSQKCKQCGKCVTACPYNAIVTIKVPCENACPVGAIAKEENGLARIDFEKCISCGKCIAACPFGAIHEKSQIIDVLKNIKQGKKVIAMFAPSIVGQFDGSIYQLRTALIKLGFSDVYEVAQGAGITTEVEAKEFIKRMSEGKPFMTTSCCAGYNELRKKHLNEINDYASETRTPLFYTAQLVKQNIEDSVTVFISPCVAKRAEVAECEYTDYIISCDELSSWFKAKNVDVKSCEETNFSKESSKQSRNYGVSSGVSEAIQNKVSDKCSVKPFVINGLNKNSIKLLKKFAQNGCCDDGCNLIEVMSCEGGCIGGNANINNLYAAKKLIDNVLSTSENEEKLD